jgi:hypothetical protein
MGWRHGHAIKDSRANSLYGILFIPRFILFYFLCISAGFLFCMHLDVLILRSVLFGSGTTWGLEFLI